VDTARRVFPFQNTDGHPRVDEHQTMADTLINFIEKNVDWNDDLSTSLKKKNYIK